MGYFGIIFFIVATTVDAFFSLKVLFLYTFSGEHTGPVWCMKFSPCGRLLATAGQDHILRVWVLKQAFNYFLDIRTRWNADVKVRQSTFVSGTPKGIHGLFSGYELNSFWNQLHPGRLRFVLLTLALREEQVLVRLLIRDSFFRIYLVFFLFFIFYPNSFLFFFSAR